MLVNILFGIALVSVLGLTYVFGYYVGVRTTVSYYNSIFKSLKKRTLYQFDNELDKDETQTSKLNH